VEFGTYGALTQDNFQLRPLLFVGLSLWILPSERQLHFVMFLGKRSFGVQQNEKVGLSVTTHKGMHHETPEI
jgi:hypothetical protein